MNRTSILTIFLAIILVIAIAATIFIVVFPKPSEPFTELYLLGPEGKASSYPTNVTVNRTANVTVGVVNHENVRVNYTLVTTLNNKTINQQSLTIANGQTWEQAIPFTPTTRGMGQKLEFDLYKGTDPTAYRSVYLYLNVR
ncbi:MAG: DUF1616 domain-containing protein [Halobacteriota archaeon]